MAALPYMPLYVADYLADAAHLSTLEHGAYLLLIMTYWQKGDNLPSSDERLARIARVTLDEWLMIRNTLAEFFIVTPEGWFHKRIQQELNKVEDKSEKARAAGKASAERRLNKRSTDVKQTFNHTDTDTDTDNKTTNVVLDIVHFAYFWSIYPRKANRKAAEKVWKSKKLDNIYQRVADDVRMRAGKHKPWLEGFIPHASTYLNGERWEDDIEEVKPGGNNATHTNTRKQELERIKNERYERNAEVFRRKRDREEAERQGK